MNDEREWMRERFPLDDAAGPAPLQNAREVEALVGAVLQGWQPPPSGGGGAEGSGSVSLALRLVSWSAIGVVGVIAIGGGVFFSWPRERPPTPAPHQGRAHVERPTPDALPIEQVEPVPIAPSVEPSPPIERPRVPLVWKLFVATAMVIVVVVGIAIAITIDRKNKVASATVNQSIAGAAELFKELEQQRLARLGLPIQLLGYDSTFHAYVQDSVLLVVEQGGSIVQETRLFDPAKGETRSMRSKEEAHDYRYFPDPDLLPLEMSMDYVEDLKRHLPELPDEKRARFIRDYGLTAYDAGVLIAERDRADFFEVVAKGRDGKTVANWVINELLGRLNKEGHDIGDSPVSAGQLGGLVDLIGSNVISGKIAKDLFEILWTEGGDPADIVEMFAPHLPQNFEADMPVVSTPLDWAGINYYSRSLIEAGPDGRPQPVKPREEVNDLGWEIYPKGLTNLLVRVSREYTKVPLYVTENGMSETDDVRREYYYDIHLQAVLDAQRQGADVRGYFAWSLIDNFEWAEGYTSRFGIVHVDYETQKRTPKGSYRAFQGMLHNTR